MGSCLVIIFVNGRYCVYASLKATNVAQCELTNFLSYSEISYLTGAFFAFDVNTHTHTHLMLDSDFSQNDSGNSIVHC